MIGLSAVASITGSVAWFTAQRTGTITTGQFAVVESDGNLELAVAAGIGTVQGANAQTINPKSESAKSSDVSFNPSSKTLWNDDNDEHTAFITIGDDDDYQDLTERSGTEPNYTYHPYIINYGSQVYYAYTWKITASYKWGADHTDVNVFFDYSGSTMTRNQKTAAADEHSEQTALGFRIAIIADCDGGRTAVVNKLQTIANFSMVDGSSATTAYTAKNDSTVSYFASDKYGKCGTSGSTSYTKAKDADSGQRNREDYLGKITYSAATDTLDLYCVAWYEGTDANVITGAAMDAVNSTLKFYACVNK